MYEDLPGISIGSNHSLETYHNTGHELCGFIEWHYTPEGNLCGGSVSVCAEHPNGRDGKTWHWSITGTLEGRDLTLHPSLQCTSCPSHGWVRDGKWTQ